ncbi:MAG: ferrous iron transport protein B [Flammeovirgaceae bacterium]|nr:ferrous iron transport protein B [Flammeovirgaceae bacterium]
MKAVLIGNPNSGKSSVFNLLTGLNQKVGNYPGITVDKKTGSFTHKGKIIELLDLPGIYSIYPKSQDEEIVYQVLSQKAHEDHPDLAIVVMDATNIERNLFLATQILDLGIPTLFLANMVDVVEKENILQLNYTKLSELLGGVTILPFSARLGKGLEDLKEAISNFSPDLALIPVIPDEFSGVTDWNKSANDQVAFGQARYKKIGQILSFCLQKQAQKDTRHSKFDRIVTHRFWGYVIFLSILAFIFQTIFAWSEWPMHLIDTVFLSLSQWTKEFLPAGPVTNLIAEGVIPGLGGVMIFIPQIALLFGFIFFLEETGYMARVVFITDRLMRPLGLNGRSIVPLISGVACAIPAVMATRTIDNWKERIITIMVTPLMSCSARLPVYTLLIALVVPDVQMGFFNLKGLVLMALYLVGFIAALLSAVVFKFILKNSEKSFLVMELPNYKTPRWSNLWITMVEKIKIFVWEAGQVIMAISVVLWVLASYGPGDRIEQAVAQIPVAAAGVSDELYQNKVNAVALEHSYIGIAGKWIEPAIKPLGYNWQIGISLITSFVAREVFVGSMATIYSVGENFESGNTLLERMSAQRDPQGQPVYTLASGFSLMLFYAFAMQCMSTLAVVRRETKSWKWPIIQLVYMTSLAYISALIAFNLLN